MCILDIFFVSTRTFALNPFSVTGQLSSRLQFLARQRLILQESVFIFKITLVLNLDNFCHTCI